MTRRLAPRSPTGPCSGPASAPPSAPCSTSSPPPPGAHPNAAAHRRRHHHADLPRAARGDRRLRAPLCRARRRPRRPGRHPGLLRHRRALPRDPRHPVRRRRLRAGRRGRPRRARRAGLRRGRGRAPSPTDWRINVHGTARAAATGGPARPTTPGSSSPPAPPASPRASRSRTRAAAAFVDAEAQLFLHRRADRPAATACWPGCRVAFDASCEEMWLAWRHGACLVPAAARAGPHRRRPRPVAGRAAHHRRLDRADAGRAVAGRRARRRPPADLRRRSLPAGAGRARRRRRPRGLEHLRPDRGHRRRLRRAADRRGPGPHRPAAGRLAARRGRRRRASRSPWARPASWSSAASAWPATSTPRRTPRSSRRCPSLGWQRAYRSGRHGPRRARGPAVPRPARRAGQARRPPHRAGRGRRRAAGAARACRARPPRSAGPRRATRCSSATSCPRAGVTFDHDAGRDPAARAPARRAGPAARRRRRPADPHLRQGRPRRAARGRCPPWTPRPGCRRPRTWLAEGWAEILGVVGRRPEGRLLHPRRRQPDRRPAGRAHPHPAPAGVGRRHLRAPEAGRAGRDAGRAERPGHRTPRDRADPAPRRGRPDAADGPADGRSSACAGRRWPPRCRTSCRCSGSPGRRR